jgi:DNA/RNA endonuclease YhcR with UshA esterase domain
MKRRLFGFCLFALSVALPLSAHHAFVAAYDMSKPITIHGVITKVQLENPHSWFYLDVKDQAGNTEQWAFEAGTPSGMLRNGYKPGVIKPGVEVTIKGFRARDVSKKRGMLQTLTTTDGQTFGMFGPQETK